MSGYVIKLKINFRKHILSIFYATICMNYLMFSLTLSRNVHFSDSYLEILEMLKDLILQVFLHRHTTKRTHFRTQEIQYWNYKLTLNVNIIWIVLPVHRTPKFYVDLKQHENQAKVWLWFFFFFNVIQKNKYIMLGKEQRETEFDQRNVFLQKFKYLLRPVKQQKRLTFLSAAPVLKDMWQTK